MRPKDSAPRNPPQSADPRAAKLRLMIKNHAPDDARALRRRFAQQRQPKKTSYDTVRDRVAHKIIEQFCYAFRDDLAGLVRWMPEVEALGFVHRDWIRGEERLYLQIPLAWD